MTLATLNKVTPNGNATLLNASLRLLAPKLVSYECELSTLINSVEADNHCAAALIRYANKRNNDPDTRIDSVKHATVFLGLIDCKQFLFAYLLLNTQPEERALVVQLAEGGRMVVPAGRFDQRLMTVTRQRGEVVVEPGERVRFVPLVEDGS